MTRRNPDIVAAVVNGLLVLIVPLALLVWLQASRLSPSDTIAIVRPPGVSGMAVDFESLVSPFVALVPCAVLAAWRTSVYARRVLARESRGWGAVGEAVACAMVPALVILLPSIFTRPLDAPPYIVAYGGGAAMIGLLVGITLRSTALLTLRLCARTV